MNQALQEAMAEADLTYEQLAVDVRRVAAEAGDSLRTGRSAVAKWVKGGRPAAPTAGYIAEAISRRLGRQVSPSELALAAPETRESDAEAELGLAPASDPVDMLRRLGDADMHRRKVLTSAAYSIAAAALPLGIDQAAEYQQRARATHRAGQAEIVAVRDMVSMFTRIDERHGGQHGRTAVVEYLRTDVAALCRATYASETERREALSTAASVAYLCGWKAYDGREHGLAQRYYNGALALTREADDAVHGAFILRIMAHNGMDIEQPAHTLALAEAAVNRVRGRVSPSTEALFTVTLARALAVAGRGTEAAAQLRLAQDQSSAGEPELPFWAALWGAPQATVASHTAKALRTLGDLSGAEAHYGASARAYGPSTPGSGDGGRRRIVALSIASQGHLQAAQGKADGACATWGEALKLLDGVRSARAADEVAGMRRRLHTLQRRGVRAAAELDEQARAWQRAHA